MRGRPPPPSPISAWARHLPRRGGGGQEARCGLAGGLGGGGGEFGVLVPVVSGKERQLAEAGGGGDAGLGGDEALADGRGSLEGGEPGLRARVVEPGGQGLDVHVVVIAEGEQRQLGGEEVGEEFGLGDVLGEGAWGAVGEFVGCDHGGLIALKMIISNPQ